MSNDNNFDAELNGIMLEYAELLQSFEKLVSDYANAKTPEEQEFINFKLAEYKRQLLILKQQVAIAKSKKK